MIISEKRKAIRLWKTGFRWFGSMVAGLLSLWLIGQIILRIRRRSHPRPIPTRLAGIMRSPFRRRWFGQPEKIVEHAGVAPGMHVLEIGPGPGNFTLPLARRVASQGMQGSITCVEIQPQMINLLRQSLAKEQINNVEILQGDAQTLSLPPESFDLVFLATVIGEIPDVQVVFDHCRQVLKPGGVLAVIEQVCDPDFHMPGSVRKLAHKAGLQDCGSTGLPWWSYTARYCKPVATPGLEQVL